MENLVESVDKIFFSTAGPVEIRFVEAEEGREEVCVPLPEGCLYEASGDNRGGFVLTVRRGD